jgi:hypothetical protein
MIEVFPGLWVGNQLDYETKVKGEEGWAVVHACKEPYHRNAVGYSGRSARHDDPEYLIAERGSRIMLNLVDVADVAYVRKDIIDRALAFIEANMGQGRRVLVHCNQGGSRAPSIALLYLGRWSADYQGIEPEAAIAQFAAAYRQYEPAQGMRDFVMQNWRQYAI